MIASSRDILPRQQELKISSQQFEVKGQQHSSQRRFRQASQGNNDLLMPKINSSREHMRTHSDIKYHSNSTSINIGSNKDLRYSVWNQALERESQRVDNLHSQDVGLLENFWKNRKTFDIQMDAHKQKEQRQKLLNKQFLVAQNRARKDAEMLSRQQLLSKGDLSVNFGLIESNNYEGGVAKEERTRVMEHKQFLMD